ncbi:MAG: DUF835 domain-containing protein [Candidatus Methanofastidiosia archaeon]
MSKGRLGILNQLEIAILSDVRNGKDENPLTGGVLSVLNSPGLYIVREKRPNRCYSLFTATVELGIEGFIISREHPRKIVQNHEVPAVPMYWLSRMGVENSISPENLMDLTKMVEDFCDQNGGCVILLDGLEYLITERAFDLVLEFLHELQYLMFIYNSRLIMPLHQGTLSFGEYDSLEEGFTIL